MASEPIWKRLGYSSRNQYRSAQARKQVNPETGKPFTSYRQQRDVQARQAGKRRDYGRERASADRLAQSRGYASANQERSVKRHAGKFDIPWDEFNNMRRANRKHWQEVNRGNLPKKFPMYLHKYQEPSRDDIGKWTGYIVSYYHAIVDEKHNWDSVRGEDGRWIMEDVDGKLTPKSDIWWYRHFVIYSDKQKQDYYETRYGVMA